MKNSNLAVGALTAYSLACALTTPARAVPIESLPIDKPMMVSNIEFACTGVGDREQHDVRWNKYPVKLEAVGGYGQYLGREELTLNGVDGAAPIRVKCEAPWVLMRLRPGHYSASIEVPGAIEKHVVFAVPAKGQRGIVVRFPSKTAGRDVDRVRGRSRT